MVLYNTELTITEEGAEPYVYTMQTEKYPRPEQIQELIFQAIEVEGLDNTGFSVQTRITKEDHATGMDEYVDGDEGFCTPHIVRTKEPSRYVQWGDNTPHIYTIDRVRSLLEFE